MKKFTVTIEETVVDTFEIVANSEKEAMEIAAKKYKNGDLVLSPGEVQSKRMSLSNPQMQNEEWVDF